MSIHKEIHREDEICAVMVAGRWSLAAGFVRMDLPHVAAALWRFFPKT